MLNQLITLAYGMNNRFPSGNTPFQITTRILEECGEVAKEVNHFENSGTKTLRHGTPSKQKLADEIKDTLNALMQLTLYYGVEEELKHSVQESIHRLKQEGYIQEECAQEEYMPRGEKSHE